MTMRSADFALILAVTIALSACGTDQDIPPGSQVGARPPLPRPSTPLVTQMHIPEVVGWKEGETPVTVKGFTVEAFARDLSSPRNLLSLPNGDVLVVEGKKTTSEPVERPKDIIMGLLMGKARGGKTKPTNQVILLRDADGDGRAEQRKVLIDSLNSPFGIAWADGELFIGATDAVLAFKFAPGATSVGAVRKVVDLPAGPINHHWTKDLAVSPDGSKLYVGVGSNSNILERGIEAEARRAAIWEVDPKTGASRIFGAGLRNPNGLTFHPSTGQLWAVINERDELGPNLVPDYLTSVKDGAFYGWPYSYYGQNVDVRAQPQKPGLVKSAISPDYALGSHVAPLGLAFYAGGSFPSMFNGGAFVGEHGSWNRDRLHGYKVVFIPFRGARPAGPPKTFVSGFIKDGKARGRPVGLAIDSKGALLIADDGGNVVWRVRYAGLPGSPPPLSTAGT